MKASSFPSNKRDLLALGSPKAQTRLQPGSCPQEGIWHLS